MLVRFFGTLGSLGFGVGLCVGALGLRCGSYLLGTVLMNGTVGAFLKIEWAVRSASLAVIRASVVKEPLEGL